MVIIHIKCDSCSQNVKIVGKLFKTGYLWLCKGCRAKRKKRR